jgi:predicted site-specific integrase-resolvase
MLPKFLLGDNTDHPDRVYVVHTEYPRFIIDLYSDEVEWLDDLENEEEEDLTDELVKLLQSADDFYQREIERFEAANS